MKELKDNDEKENSAVKINRIVTELSGRNAPELLAKPRALLLNEFHEATGVILPSLSKRNRTDS